jgi:hypothetical protein
MYNPVSDKVVINDGHGGKTSYKDVTDGRTCLLAIGCN